MIGRIDKAEVEILGVQIGGAGIEGKSRDRLGQSSRGSTPLLMASVSLPRWYCPWTTNLRIGEVVDLRQLHVAE